MKGSVDKVIPLSEAAAMVEAGMNIVAGGFAASHQPMAFFREVIRRAPGKVSMAAVAECWVVEFLAAAGMLERVALSCLMFEQLGRCHRFSRAVEEGTIAVEDHSHFGLVSRIAAAAQGIPFLPVRSMTGTDVLNRQGYERPEDKWRRIPSPFGNEEVTAISAIVPDLAVIHVARVDRRGNAQLFGPTTIVEEQAKAARAVIVTAEELVDSVDIARCPEFTVIPGFMVDAVVHLPFGAHPTGMFGYYDCDHPHLAEYHGGSRDDGALAAFMERYVYGPADHWDYLERIGIGRLMALRVDPALGYRRPEGR